MLSENEKLSLANIGKGAVIEKFDTAFQKIITNIMDHNSSDKPRTITVQAKVGPINESRNLVGIEVTHDVKNPKSKPFVTSATLGLDEKGRAYAQETPKQQLPLPKVVDFGEKTETSN